MIVKYLNYRIKTYLNIFIAALIPDTYRSTIKCDVLLCCSDANRADTLNGRAYSRLIDSMQADLDEKGWICKQFSFPPSVFVGDKAWGRPVTANRRFLFFSILKKINKVIRYYKPKQMISNNVNRYELDDLFLEIIDNTKPKCIITINAPPALCRSAKYRNIPVYELLHGIGYSVLPWGWGQEVVENLPDGILSLDKVSTDTFSFLKPKHIKVIQIPHPFIRRFKDERNNELPCEWVFKPSWLPNKKIIIYSMQWGYDGEHSQYNGILKNGIMHEELIRAIEETKDEVFWLLRLHPVQLRSRKYKHHINYMHNIVNKYSNTEWENSSVYPLPSILKVSDGHVAMSSMSAYDAAFMGVKSLMLCPSLKKDGVNSTMFEDLRSSGFVSMGDLCAESIKDWVLNVEKADKDFLLGTKDSDMNVAVKTMLGRVYKDENS